MQGSTYALIGVGFIAPRHMKAIRDTGGELIAALNPHDSVGIIDSYFPNCHFFTEFEIFDRHIFKIHADYLVVCSPNYLHDTHTRWGLRLGMKVICEKPVSIHPDNIVYDERVNVVLQLRYHPVFAGIKVLGHSFVHIKNITPRGNWYDYSWKSDVSKSGGLLMNIGIHLFDIMIFKFGKWKSFTIERMTPREVRGIVYLERADVTFFLSVNGNKYDRIISINGDEIDFTDGFNDLHTECYRQIHAGNGIKPASCYDAISLIHEMSKWYLSQEREPRVP